MFGRRPETERNERTDILRYFGTYSTEDARLILDAFVGEDIEFSLDIDKMGSNAPAAHARASGPEACIAIGVHADEYNRTWEIPQCVLKILT